MPFLVPNPSDVVIKNTENETFPYRTVNTNISVLTKESGSGAHFWSSGSRLLKCAKTTPSSPNSTTAQGTIMATGIPCLCSELSIKFSFNYTTPISCLSQYIKHEYAFDDTWRATMGNMDVRTNGTLTHFIFGLSGFIDNTKPNGNKYHFRFVFQNHSNAREKQNPDDITPDSSKPWQQVFYINFDDKITLYDKNGNNLGTIRERENNPETSSSVSLGEYCFLPSSEIYEVEMYLDRFTVNGHKPTHVMYHQQATQDTREFYVIDQNTWGTTNGLMSCRGTIENGTATRNIRLYPYNVSCGNGDAGRKEMCIFGTRRRELQPINATKIFPIHCKIYEVMMFFGKAKIPVLHYFPYTSESPQTIPGTSLSCVNWMWDDIRKTSIPLHHDTSDNKNDSLGDVHYANTPLSTCICFSQEDIVEEENFYLEERFTHWENNNRSLTALANTVATDTFGNGKIHACYKDDHLLLNVDVLDGQITDLVSGKHPITLPDSGYAPNSGYDFIKTGYKINGNIHVPTVVENKYIRVGILEGFACSPDLFKFPCPRRANSVTVMGWFKFDHMGHVFINSNGTTTSYSPSDTQLENWRTDQIPEEGFYSLGGWAHLDLAAIWVSWKNNQFTIDRDSGHNWYWELNANSAFDKFTSIHGTQGDVRGCLNFALMNTRMDDIPVDSENFYRKTQLESSGQLVAKSIIPSGDNKYINKSNYPTIKSHIDKIKNNWTFFAATIDVGGLAGALGDHRDNRGFALGFIRNKAGTELVTNPMVRSLSVENQRGFSISRSVPGRMDRTNLDPDLGWFSFCGSPPNLNKTLLDDLSNGYPEGWRNPGYYCKSVRVYDRAFTMDELSATYENEKNIFP